MWKKPIYVVVLCLTLLLAGCVTICKNYTEARQAQLQATLQTLQVGYGTMTNILQTSPDPRVYIAVALTDAALHLVGAILNQYCPKDADIALAESTARAAVKAKAAAGIQ